MSTYKEIEINQIKANTYQPRSAFDEQLIASLATSIKENGLLQPIIVREAIDGYEIVAGERRFRACRSLGQEKIKAIVIRVSENKSAQLALIENIQREDLNAIDEAKAYQQIMELSSLTQQQLADKLGLSQSSVANKMRLLNLNEDVKAAISEKKITERHGRAMLSLSKSQQQEVLKTILDKDLNVAQSESYIATLDSQKEKKVKSKTKCIGVSTKLVIDAFNKTYKQVKQLNSNISFNQEESEQEVVLTIRIKK